MIPLTEMTPIDGQATLSRAAAAIAECRLIATMSEEPGRTTRRFLTPPVAQVHAHLSKRMKSLGMSVYVDGCGNLRGLWEPENAKSKRLLLGSHIDTVPEAGAFDGVLGVVLALEWVQQAQKLLFPAAIEVIAFSEEEGVRYGAPFLGSRAVAGVFDPKLLEYKDIDGISMADAIRDFGLDPDRIPAAVIDDHVQHVLGFVEIHIEQGPILEAEGLPLAVVEGIAGQSRLGFRFVGRANHAGTTPMHLRKDALAAAAEWMTSVESFAKATDGLVATFGKISVKPDAANVIPGEASVSLDVRHMSNEIRQSNIVKFIALARSIAASRGVLVESDSIMDEATVPMDVGLSADLAVTVERAGFTPRRIPSGAGHDAMIMAHKVPTAMLFLRSPGGISHHPDESVLEEDVEAAIKVGEVFLRLIASKLNT